MTPKFFCVLLALLLIAPVSALTLSGNLNTAATLEPGDSIKGKFTVASDANYEKILQSVSVTGDEELVKLIVINTSTMPANLSQPITVQFQATAPEYNGTYTAKIESRPESTGDFGYHVDAVIRMTVINGKPSLTTPTPTPEPTTVTTQTPTQTASSPTPKTTYAPIEPVIVIGAVSVLLVIRRRP